MNQRESSGLPLRAMVMVLLFLGVVFLLVGFQAMGNDGDSGADDSDSSIAASTTTTTSHDVHPRGAGQGRGAGVQHLDDRRCRETHGQPAERGRLERHRDGQPELPDITVTTVFFSDAPGEQQAAEEVGRCSRRPVAPRLPELAEQPPGVIVAVTG